MCCTGAGSMSRGRIGSSCGSKGSTGRWGGPRRTTARARPELGSGRAPAMASRMRRRWAVREACVLDLADCTEFRQALAARPPGFVHGAALLLVALLGAALGWSALTRADLVVRAPGRVRPVVTPVRVFPAARGEALSASTGGRVAAVHFREGDEVRRGAVLIQLETGRLDHEIARKRRIIDAVAEELTRLAHLEGLASRQFEAARA